jgi:hypothetical protein
VRAVSLALARLLAEQEVRELVAALPKLSAAVAPGRRGSIALTMISVPGPCLPCSSAPYDQLVDRPHGAAGAARAAFDEWISYELGDTAGECCSLPRAEL